jgi:Rha family phage regulatory protein
VKDLGLIIRESKVVVSSRDVAEVYGKEHKDVLKKIRDFIQIVPELGRRNFTPSVYVNDQNKEMPEFLMDRQGFSILVNKFTGEDALKFTVKYTKAFEDMAKSLEQQAPGCIEDLIILQARTLKETREKAERAEALAQAAASRVEQLENKIEKRMTEEFLLQLVTASQLGQMFEPKLSAQEINKRLKAAGLQWRVGGDWVATAEGGKYSSAEPVQLENGRMIYQLKWQRIVREMII